MRDTHNRDSDDASDNDSNSNSNSDIKMLGLQERARINNNGVTYDSNDSDHDECIYNNDEES